MLGLAGQLQLGFLQPRMPRLLAGRIVGLFGSVPVSGKPLNALLLESLVKKFWGVSICRQPFNDTDYARL